MQPLRVLFVIRPDSESRLGGDAVQATHTAAALRDLGHTVDVVPAAEPDARGYDVAHVFGVFDPPLAQAQISACKQSGAAIALSPIWWDLTEFYARSAAVERALRLPARRVERRLHDVRERAPQQLLSRRDRQQARKRKDVQRALMEQAGVLLPNSIIEAHRYVCDLGLQHPNVHVVPNAVDARTDGAYAGERSGVLCVGRVESRKNQAMLAYALRDDDVEITLAGECYDEYYRKLCERWNPRVRFTGALRREDALTLMGRALVHALPAWLETPGIASLEAGMMGCAVVNGNRASEFEYFEGDAWYCDPGSAQSIREAVLRALESARNGTPAALRARMETFTWKRAAEATLAAYCALLKRNSKSQFTRCKI